MNSQLWTVVLAAGEGRRLAGVTGGVPKQFWRGVSGTSLLAQTIERFAPLTPRRRTIVIVDAAHEGHVRTSGLSAATGALVIQPQDRGTAAGVLLALTPVLESSPDDIVVVTPSDHGVIDGSSFRSGVLAAASHVRKREDIVLFGVEPTAVHQDYGWISVGRKPSGALRPVESFVEKPDAQVAARLFAAGAIWNTMVIVARARAIRDLYVELLPELAGVFAAALRLPASERTSFLAGVYPTLPRFDFSRDLMMRARRLSAYVWPASLGWTDLGTPERLREWHLRVAPQLAVA